DEVAESKEAAIGPMVPDGAFEELIVFVDLLDLGIGADERIERRIELLDRAWGRLGFRSWEAEGNRHGCSGQEQELLHFMSPQGRPGRHVSPPYSTDRKRPSDAPKLTPS